MLPSSRTKKDNRWRGSRGRDPVSPDVVARGYIPIRSAQRQASSGDDRRDSRQSTPRVRLSCEDTTGSRSAARMAVRAVLVQLRRFLAVTRAVGAPLIERSRLRTRCGEGDPCYRRPQAGGCPR